MRNYSNSELNTIASEISSRITSKENTEYYEGRTWGYWVDSEKLKSILAEYNWTKELTQEDAEVLKTMLDSKIRTKASIKATGVNIWSNIYPLLIIIGIMMLIAAIFS